MTIPYHKVAEKFTTNNNEINDIDKLKVCMNDCFKNFFGKDVFPMVKDNNGDLVIRAKQDNGLKETVIQKTNGYALNGLDMLLYARFGLVYSAAKTVGKKVLDSAFEKHLQNNQNINHSVNAPTAVNQLLTDGITGYALHKYFPNHENELKKEIGNKIQFYVADGQKIKLNFNGNEMNIDNEKDLQEKFSTIIKNNYANTLTQSSHHKLKM